MADLEFLSTIPIFSFFTRPELEAASTHLMALLSAQYKRAARAVAARSTNPAHEQQGV